jgi:hypothetical protein
MVGPSIIAMGLGVGVGAAGAVAVIHLRNHWRNDWRAWIESLSLLAVVTYSATAYFQWRALTVSNEQTQKAFRIANRAYLAAGQPSFDPKTRLFTLSVRNHGHLPTGSVDLAIHEATLDSTIPNAINADANDVAEAHWRPHTLAPFPPDSDALPIAVAIHGYSEDKYTPQGAFQQIFVAGRISYDDAFSEDGPQSYDFCYRSGYSTEMQKLYFTPCDPRKVLPALEKRDGYPQVQASAPAGHP